MFTKLALKLGAAAEAVIAAGSRPWHGRVNRVVDWIESEVDGKVTGKVGNAAWVTAGDKLASEIDVTFGSNFAPNWLFNVVGGADNNVASMLAHRIGLEVVVGIGIDARLKERVRNCYSD